MTLVSVRFFPPQFLFLLARIHRFVHSLPSERLSDFDGAVESPAFRGLIRHGQSVPAVVCSLSKVLFVARRPMSLGCVARNLSVECTSGTLPKARWAEKFAIVLYYHF